MKLRERVFQPGWNRLEKSRLEARAAAAGVAEIELAAVLGSRSFYEALGYTLQEERCHTLDNGDDLRFYWMTKCMHPAPE